MRSPQVSDRQVLHLVEHRLRQAAPANNSTFSRLKKFCAQLRVRAEERQQRLVALGHVEVPGRRDLAQIAHRLLDQAGHRLAFVDIHRAAVVEHEADIVIAAGGVVPWRPVDNHRRLVLEIGQRRAQHHLVGAPHALGVDHAFGHAGRAGGEQDLGDGVRADACRGRHRPPRSPRSRPVQRTAWSAGSEADCA